MADEVKPYTAKDARLEAMYYCQRYEFRMSGAKINDPQTAVTLERYAEMLEAMEAIAKSARTSVCAASDDHHADLESIAALAGRFIVPVTA